MLGDDPLWIDAETKVADLDAGDMDVLPGLLGKLKGSVRTSLAKGAAS